MEFHSKIINDLVNQLMMLPGIGKRTAIRMVLSMLKQNKEYAKGLGDLIVKTTTDIKYCKTCFNISDNNICGICADHSREASTICVVEDIRDIIAIEQTAQFKGLYHVLGGLISPIDGVNPNDIKVSELIERVNNGTVNEIIFALSANMEGDTTMFYIAKQFNNPNLKFSVISRGISIGGEIEYADEITLGRSILNRTSYNVN